jgi:hypothetical protein
VTGVAQLKDASTNPGDRRTAVDHVRQQEVDSGDPARAGATEGS